jgi:hypothetical protein
MQGRASPFWWDICVFRQSRKTQISRAKGEREGTWFPHAPIENPADGLLSSNPTSAQVAETHFYFTDSNHLQDVRHSIQSGSISTLLSAIPQQAKTLKTP